MASSPWPIGGLGGSSGPRRWFQLIPSSHDILIIGVHDVPRLHTKYEDHRYHLRLFSSFVQCSVVWQHDTGRTHAHDTGLAGYRAYQQRGVGLAKAPVL